MPRFDRVIINFEKGYIFETNGTYGVIEKVEKDKIEIDLPITFNKKQIKAANDLLEKVSTNLTGQAVPFDTDLLKKALDKLNGDAILEIAQSDINEKAYTLVIRTSNKCALVMSLAPVTEYQHFYAPWQSAKIEQNESEESQNV